MNSTIIVAIIAAVGSLGGSLIAGYFSGSKTIYRIEQLEKKVEKHNNLIERTYRLERHSDVSDEQIRVINHRIADLEEQTQTIINHLGGMDK